MAALQAHSALGRPRLTRKPLGGHPASSSSSSSASATATASGAAVAHREPTNSTTAAFSSSSIDIPTASHIGLFLSNLRLLDLDLLEDWPNITPHTFSSTKDAAGQGHKRRVYCVEWALYQLFSIWDPEESRNKLQPYFPPLDQVQSLNLRAALLRCLEHAKKTGVLGRDAVVRKTMLDECRGERLEEVLAVFSSAVLKTVVSENSQSDRYPPLAQTIALERRGYSADRTELHALILAHKASLNRLLGHKTSARHRYEDFSRLLDAKETNIAKRKAEIDAIKRQNNSISDDEKLAVWKTLRNNWSGNQRWMETLLYGDTGAKRDAVLAAPFDRVWRRVQAGRVSDLEDNTAGLLGQLEARVKAQRERLGRWEKFRERLLASSSAAEKEDQGGDGGEKRQRGIDLGFKAHENVRPGLMSPRRPHANAESRTRPTGEYARILDSLETELANAGKGQGPGLLALLAPEPGEQKVKEMVPGAEDEPASELSEIEEEVIPSPKKHKEPKYSSAMAPEYPEAEAEASSTRNKNPETIREADQSRRRVQRSSTYQPAREERISSGPRRPLSISGSISRRPPIITSDRPTRNPSASPERPSKLRTQVTPPRKSSSPPAQPEPVLGQEPSSPTQAMANDILTSVSNISPSPIKRSSRHTLSLQERTRLSMVRAPRGSGGAGDEDIRLSISPTKPSMAAEKPDAEDGEDGLVARTRRSMAGFEAAKQKAQLERRRSQKKSRKPQQAPGRRETVARFLDEMEEEEEEDKEKNEKEKEGEGINVVVVHEDGQRQGLQEEKARGREQEAVIATAAAAEINVDDSLLHETTLLAEELIEAGQADYEAVFMSRPKIKTSPLPSPVREGTGRGGRGGGGDRFKRDVGAVGASARRQE